MKLKKQPLIAIVGPTASGKSALAVGLAKKFNGEIISADSRQVYRGLDIGTGKITRGEMRGVTHHLLDVANPKRRFSVADFQRLAKDAIKNIAARGKIPFLAGGTGFWIDAVVCDLDLPRVPPDRKLRARLAKKNPAELLAALNRLDPRRAITVEQKNPRRLIRAIEIAKAIGRAPELKKHSPYRMLWIGVKPDEKMLKRLIRRRLLKRIKAGMILEAKRLKKSGLSWKRFYELGLEYRFLADYLRGKMTKDEMIKRLETAIRQYARRQMTWFKRNRDIRWIKNAKEGQKLVSEFLTERQ